MYIYKITNPEGNIYIGQTVDLEARLTKYRRLLCSNQKYLYNSLQKYGFERHVVEVIDRATTRDELNLKEITYIEALKTNKKRYPNSNGMNLADGGIGGSSKGHKWSEEAKQRVTGRNHWAYGKPKEYLVARNRLSKGIKSPRHSEFMKGRAHRKKAVMNKETGVVYNSVKEAAIAANLTPGHLRKILRGERPNYTKYVLS